MYKLLKKEIKEDGSFEIYRIFPKNMDFNLCFEHEYDMLEELISPINNLISELSYEDVHTFLNGNRLVKITGYYEMDNEELEQELQYINERDIDNIFYLEFGFIPLEYKKYSQLQDIVNENKENLNIENILDINISNISGVNTIGEAIILSKYANNIYYIDGNYYFVTKKGEPLKILDEIIESNKLDLVHWYEYDFDSDCCPPIELMKNNTWEKDGYTEDDIDMAKFDFIYSIVDDYVALVCKRLNIDCDTNSRLVEDIYDDIKDAFRNKLI